MHVLQPNQYVGSHQFSSAEEAIALKPRSPYAEAIESIYPLFQSHIERLAESGVELIDATSVFDSSAATIYVDNCCHFNQTGNEILADHLVRSIKPILAEKMQQ